MGNSSRLSKYLKQSAVLQQPLVDATGKIIQNIHGEPEYGAPISIKCRKESLNVVDSNSVGQYIRTVNVYYIDTSVIPVINSRINGNTVTQITDYVDGTGMLIGYQVQTNA